MRILYYIPHLKKEFGGSYQYAIALLKILVQDTDNKYVIFNIDDNPDVVEILKGRPNFSFIENSDYIDLDRSDKKWTRLRLSFWLRSKRLKKYVARDGKLFLLLAKYKIDIIHSPYQLLPKCSLPKIATMHDVQELHFPAFFSSTERAYRAVHYKNIIDRAEKIVVSYNHIKCDIVKFFSKNPADISTILLDMENLWIDNFKTTSAQENPGFGKYLLYPAATWEHKNHVNLIKAVQTIRDEKGISIQVICTGNKTSHFDTINKLLVDLELSENIRFLGIVDDKKLYSLYFHAHGVVVPTLYEAGSFPLMESILLNRPVICSKVTSLPETIGSDEFIFDPNNVDEMSNQIWKLWVDYDFRKRNIELVKNRAKSLRFNNSLSKFLELYSSMLRN